MPHEGTVPPVLRFRGLALCAACLLWSSSAIAQPSGEPASDEAAADKPSEAPLPSCLDQTIRDQLGAELKPRGVQKRDFQKDNKLVIGLRGGLYGGDLTSSSWIAGGSLGYFFTE